MLDRAGVQTPQELGLVAGALELMRSQDVGEIDQCSGDRRDRQTVGLAYDVDEGSSVWLRWTRSAGVERLSCDVVSSSLPDDGGHISHTAAAVR